MFTGIVETIGQVIAIDKQQQNISFEITSSFCDELKIDQSISHNGVCLTVTALTTKSHWVTAVNETLLKTNLGMIQVGNFVNLERCMPANGRFDGHIVQGHIDQIGICTQVSEVGGSWLYDFQYDASLGNFTVEKGSICINGVSLTVFESEQNSFRVTIIPYTHEYTTFKHIQIGSTVNLEFDVVGKYIKKLLANSGFEATGNLNLKL